MCGTGDYWLKTAAQTLAPNSAAPERRALIIFVRKPELGKVKTRLAATLGDAAALHAYERMLAHTRGVALSTPCERFLFYAGEIATQDDWDCADFQKHAQAPGELGARMQAAFETVFALGHDKAIIIGSDCLDLRPSHLSSAFRALALHDFVLGPASDGGYYLLGMRSLAPALFQHKQWSTDSVLRDTAADIEAMGKSLHTLQTLHDIDTEVDYRAALVRNGLEMEV